MKTAVYALVHDGREVYIGVASDPPKRLPPWNGTYRAKVARKAAREAGERAEWEALAAKNKADWDAANAEYEAAMRNE